MFTSHFLGWTQAIVHVAKCALFMAIALTCMNFTPHSIHFCNPFAWFYCLNLPHSFQKPSGCNHVDSSAACCFVRTCSDCCFRSESFTKFCRSTSTSRKRYVPIFKHIHEQSSARILWCDLLLIQNAYSGAYRFLLQ